MIYNYVTWDLGWVYYAGKLARTMIRVANNFGIVASLFVVFFLVLLSYIRKSADESV